MNDESSVYEDCQSQVDRATDPKIFKVSDPEEISPDPSHKGENPGSQTEFETNEPTSCCEPRKCYLM